MEEPECVRCGRKESEVKLLDAIYENELVKICEECSIIENIPIIRKPNTFQLKAAESKQTVYERMARMAGYKKSEIQEKVNQQETRKVQEFMKKLTYVEPDTSMLSIKKRQELAKKANEPVSLIDNFHWHILMARRKKKLSQKQLADAIGENEKIIEMIEAGNLPDDSKRIISKIEQYLGMILNKNEFLAEQRKTESIKQPSRVLNFDKESMQNLKISDLIEMKKKQERLEKEQEESASREESREIELDKG